MTAAVDGSAERFLGLDFGTESVRALLVDRRGAVAASATASYPSGQIVRGSPAAARFAEPLPAAWALQDPDDWLDAASRAVRLAVATAGIDPASVGGIGVDCTSCTVLPPLADGTPLSQTPWSDRPHAWPKLWKHHGAQAQATRLTEVARDRGEPWLARYGGDVGLEWLFPKLLEVFDDDPDVAAAADIWLEGGDWLVWQLTGAPSLGGDRDAATLVRSTCQAGYKALWSRADGYPGDDYLESCRPGFAPIARRLLGRPTFVAPGERAGELSAAAAAHLGLVAGTPMSAAVIDAHAGVPGAGVGTTGTLVLVLGTSGCHMVMDAAEHRIPGVAGVVSDGILPGWFGYETGQAAVGDAFEWVRRLCGAADHAALEAEAREVPIGSEGLVAVDWFNGCRTPLMDGSLTGAVLGATLHHGPGHLYRAVLEASACGLAWIVDTLRDGGVAIDRFVATGGLPGQNLLFAEIVASVLGAPIEVPVVEHGPALGAAVLGAAAAGAFATVADAVEHMAGVASAQPAPRVIHPDAAAIDAYRSVIERYRVAADLVRRAASSAPVPEDRIGATR
jgi:L-ribulokinase